jgi:DNA repair protein RecN (Recombination protein N)
MPYKNLSAPRKVASVNAEIRGVAMLTNPSIVALVSTDPVKLAIHPASGTAKVVNLSLSGADEVAFLIRPNRGLPFGPVAETASGGELSRIALAIAAVAGGETLVFDEIDAGIGGETANAVGRVLQRLAERAQVITITHLPQIAALADRHFRVEKVPGDPTHTQITALADGERKAELERMLGGEGFLATVRG